MKKINKTKKKMIILTVLVITINFLLIPSINAQIKNKFENRQIIQKLNYSQSKDIDLLIITVKRFSTILESLTDHKKDVGISSKIVTINNIYNGEIFETKGRDKQEQIKYFIKNAIEEWNITYVLIVGGAREIPSRYSNTVMYDTDQPDWYNHPAKTEFMSDLYYADIYDSEGNFSSWDNNNNGIYAEWKGKVAEDYDIDLYPDVFLGRLPCRNRLEVRIVINKIISYERETYGKSWFKNIAVVAGDTDPRYWIPRWRKYEGEITSQEILNNMTNFGHTKLWTSNGNLKNRMDVIKTFYQGIGFIYFNGHGNPLGCLTLKPRELDGYIRCLDIYSIPLLMNGKKLPISFLAVCSGCNFNVSLLKIFDEESSITGDFAPECWGWHLVRKPWGGSIASLGYTGIAYVDLDKDSGQGAGDYIENQFFWEYGVNNTDILGKVWGNTITNYLNTFQINWSTRAGCDYAIDAESVENFVLLGDPSLKIGGYNESEITKK